MFLAAFGIVSVFALRQVELLGWMDGWMVGCWLARILSADKVHIK